VDALSEKLLRWFEARREIAAVRLLRQHAIATTDVADDLVKAVDSAKEGKEGELRAG